ncbi:TIGR03936 family radical SAM-associated protein [Thermosipho atlanticus]|uniref:Radical SAM-linked protein n=1 Tax=Thermosipho atlanticus DSM 15807 TaxID=1123380 RepID=A0A1M5TQ15_9BACT|nr:TIGR03936 family radical SAM-associated protein [Thermosipho atlanticus]SHH52852.1 radical SAM-linked protein [Thermosipho atlanticus DSM 15807]
MSKSYTILLKKIGLYRYVSALDTITMIERTFRRSKLNLCYTEGYHPKPKFSYIDPVPTGVIDLAFYLNAFFNETYETDYIFEKIKSVQPKHLKIENVFANTINFSEINKFQFSLIIKKPFKFDRRQIIEKKTKRGIRLISLENLENVEIFEKKDYIVLNYIIGKVNLFNPYQLSDNVYLAIRKEAFIDNIPLSKLLNKSDEV